MAICCLLGLGVLEGRKNAASQSLQTVLRLHAIQADASATSSCSRDPPPVDCLAGASFAWTTPPEVIAVQKGSPADGNLTA